MNLSARRGGWWWLALVLASALGAAPGCTGCLGLETSPVDTLGSTLPPSCQAQPPLAQPQRLEILFVIDNSGSMAPSQAAVARELTSFVEQIRQGGGVPQDFQVGVVTTSVYQHTQWHGTDYVRYFPAQSGWLQPVPDVLDGGTFVYQTHNERVLLGDDPDLVSKFTLLAQQGIAGSGQETPFEAVRLALLGEPSTIPVAQGGNQGFLRDGSRLLVVVLSDEDDCSEEARPPKVWVTNDPSVPDCVAEAALLTSVPEYHRLFTTQLGNADGTPREVIWAEIAPVARGTKEASLILDNGQVRNVDCPTSHGAGVRHRAMAELFDPSLQNLDSICNDSFHDTLVRIGALASVSQTLEVTGVADERLLQAVLTRKDGTEQDCTLSNGGIVSFSREDGGATSKLQFGNQCLRRADDRLVTFKLLCAT
jgi:hypothetical protein